MSTTASTTAPSAPAPAPAHDPADRAAQRDQEARHYGEMLRELASMAMDLARTLHRQVTAEPAPEHPAATAAAPGPAPDLTIPFERAARTVRRTVLLARKLSEPDRPSPAALAALRATAETQARRTTARKQIIREVEDVIQREADGIEADMLEAEFYDRLENLDLDDDIERLPIAEIIANIRRDLGVAPHFPGTHPWKRRSPAEVRALAARAMQPSAVQPSAARPQPPSKPQPTPAKSPLCTLHTGPPRA